MSAAEIETDNEWLPQHCPKWCDGQHAQAVAEGNSWESSQQHLCSGSGEVLSEINYADRPVRPWGGGWGLTATQRPLGEHGGNWGPPLINLDINGPLIEGRERGLTLHLTTGEALVLARHLVALVDRVEA